MKIWLNTEVGGENFTSLWECYNSQEKGSQKTWEESEFRIETGTILQRGPTGSESVC